MKYQAVVRGGRAKLVEAMNNIIIAINDESAYCSWIYLVPDEATQEDFNDIAADEDMFSDVCVLFRKLLKKYGESGFYVAFDDKSF